MHEIVEANVESLTSTLGEVRCLVCGASETYAVYDEDPKDAHKRLNAKPCLSPQQFIE